MPDTPEIIAYLCDADNYTKYLVAQMGRDAFTVADLKKMKGEE